MEAAIRLGIDKFDTAPLYGYGRAEKDIGRLVHSGLRPEVTTKVGLRPGGLARMTAWAHRPVRKVLSGSAAIRRYARSLDALGGKAEELDQESVLGGVQESLARLNLSSLEALLLHDVSPDAVSPECVRVLMQLKADGVVRWLGVAGDTKVVRSIISMHEGVFDVVQVPGRLADLGPRGVLGLRTIRYGLVSENLAQIEQWIQSDPNNLSLLEGVYGAPVRTTESVVLLLINAWLNFSNDDVIVGSSQLNHLVSLSEAAISRGSMPRETLQVLQAACRAQGEWR